ncbi:MULTISPECIES: AraC family transcriptional regulator [unclassified Saccharicrinis]|uniref:AraC family transcriptional regulator n=1 Tax=unclassified Saccharicrinis TaxID=2646859 RepID=UPI003D324F25
MKTDQPRIKELDTREVACVSFVGDFVGKQEIFSDLFNKLCGWAGTKGLISETSVFLVSYENCSKTTPPEEFKLDICMSIPQDIEAEGEIQRKSLPGGQYAVQHCELAGPKEYETVWNKLEDWADKNNFEMDMSRPSYEIYLNNSDEHPEKQQILDICLSVKLKG